MCLITGWFGKGCSEPCTSDVDCRYVPVTPNKDWVSSRASSAEIVADRSEMNGMTGMTELSVLPHPGFYFIMICMISIILLLLYASLSYRRRLKIIQDELYYVTYSTSSNGGGSVGESSRSGNFENALYSLENGSTSTYSDSQQFPDKERSFSTAARDVPSKMSPSTSSQGREKLAHYPVNRKIEFNLLTSKKQAEENLYSEQSNQSSVLNMAMPSITPILPSNNDYQVPRPPVRIALNSGHHGSIDEEQSNIYEEIKSPTIHRCDNS